jgi:hypothetical protein
MEVKGAPVHFVREDDNAALVVAGRSAALVTLAGCSLTFLSTLLPWVEKAAFGISLATTGIQSARVLLAVLALISAGTAGVVLQRRRATAGVAIVLIVLAVMQLGVALWDGANIVYAIEQVSSHQVLFSAIGTGVYGTVVGSVVTVAGGILAWTRQGRRG